MGMRETLEKDAFIDALVDSVMLLQIKALKVELDAYNKTENRSLLHNENVTKPTNESRSKDLFEMMQTLQEQK